MLGPILMKLFLRYAGGSRSERNLKILTDTWATSSDALMNNKFAVGLAVKSFPEPKSQIDQRDKCRNFY